MMGMCSMQGMMQKTMVATEDGGVVVMMGDKLVKYDKDLNKVKEVAIPMDVEQMQGGMQKMQQGCPRHQEMMKESSMPQKGSTPEPPTHEGHD